MALSRGTTFTPDPQVVKKEKEKAPSPVAVVETNPMFGKISLEGYQPPSKSKLEKTLGVTR
ncbi:MAG: hypothetical protein D0530_04865 [Methylococcales bacterium]|nr:MAG: hypothetical protein D0530_04865 [Methylococcales bacterium]